MHADNVDLAIKLVKSAIARIKSAKDHAVRVHADPAANGDDCGAADINAQAAEREFAWQWENVEMILRDRGI